MASILRLGFIACLLASCVGEEASVRHTSEKISREMASIAGTSFQLTRADLRPLSKTEIQNSIQDVFRLSAPPELDGFSEQSSRSQIFRNSYHIMNDSSSLAGLSREVHSLIGSLSIPALSKLLVECDAVASDNCRLRFVQRIATHAWRRPLTALENSMFERQATEISKLAPTVQDQALHHVLGQIIFDPRFLFRIELGAESDTSSPHYALAAWEKLSAISYDLKHRPPTFEQIKELAEFENDPKRFLKLIDEIVDSSSMAVSLASLISQWLMYYGLESMEIQGDPNWSKQKAQEQTAAAHRFVAETLANDGTLRSLFTKPNPENEGFGIFSSRAFLTSTSKNGQASMILRGVRIIRNALCQDMAVPPGSLESLPPKDLSPADPHYSIKLTLMHGARPDCSGCHRLIDPAGLALQVFDGFGANTVSAVDLSALGIPSQVMVMLGGQSESITTSSVKDFTESIANSSTFARCFSRNALRYILGRDLTPMEIVTADKLADSHLMTQASAKDSLANYFRDIMSSDTVYMRSR